MCEDNEWDEREKENAVNEESVLVLAACTCDCFCFASRPLLRSVPVASKTCLPLDKLELPALDGGGGGGMTKSVPIPNIFKNERDVRRLSLLPTTAVIG